MSERFEGTLSRGELDVILERRRQVNSEGFTPEHDDEHDDKSLEAAAACFAVPNMATKTLRGEVNVSGGRGETPVWENRKFVVPKLWPASWSPEWWKPTEYRRCLVIAAALLLAAIDRLDRLADRGPAS
jgi:hypothetical protein